MWRNESLARSSNPRRFMLNLWPPRQTLPVPGPGEATVDSLCDRRATTAWEAIVELTSDRTCHLPLLDIGGQHPHNLYARSMLSQFAPSRWGTGSLSLATRRYPTDLVIGE